MATWTLLFKFLLKRSISNKEWWASNSWSSSPVSGENTTSLVCSWVRTGVTFTKKKKKNKEWWEQNKIRKMLLTSHIHVILRPKWLTIAFIIPVKMKRALFHAKSCFGPHLQIRYVIVLLALSYAPQAHWQHIKQTVVA